MKKTLAFLAFVCVLSTLSCTLRIGNTREDKKENKGDDKKENKREDVFGLWEATKNSLKKQNQNKIFSFQLNKDSTAIILRDNITQEKKKGTWLWNIEKGLGNNIFSVGFRCDVWLDVVDYGLVLALRLEERSGNLYLEAGDYEFKKVD